MQLTLFHNPGSGDEDHSRKWLLKLLRRHGYDAVYYQSTKDEGWEQAVDRPADLVAIAGGDGTVDKVLPRLSGTGVPIGIIPLGTANNVATALGGMAKADDLVGAWSAARRRPFDLGIATGPWGTRTFVEAVGLGAFPQLMPVLKAVSKHRQRNGKKGAKHRLQHHLDGIRSMFSDCRSVPWELTLNGVKVTEDCLVLEAMNIDAIGPGLKIAPAADPSDGLLDLVLIGDAEQEAFQEYLDRRTDADEEPAVFPTRRAERIEILWSGSLLHIDGDLWAGRDVVLPDVQTVDPPGPTAVTLQVLKHAVEVLIPEID